MMDYQNTLYGPIYLAQGVDALLTLADNRMAEIVVLDKTAGIDIGESGGQLQTIKPAAAVRVPDLTERGIEVTDLPRAKIFFNGFQWTVTSYKLRPSPNGERDGEAYLILTSRTVVSESE